MGCTTVPIDHTDISGQLEHPKDATQDRTRADFAVLATCPVRNSAGAQALPEADFHENSKQ